MVHLVESLQHCSVESASGDHASHSLLHLIWQFEGGQFLLKLCQSAVATTVAIQSAGNMGGDEFCIGQVERQQDISLLTQQILLMKAVVREK